jgi:hypothetical protein
MMYSALEAVDRALKLLDSPGRWTTGCNARTPEGKAVPWHSFEARKWDVEGASGARPARPKTAVWRDLFWSYRTDEETGKLSRFQGHWFWPFRHTAICSIGTTKPIEPTRMR